MNHVCLFSGVGMDSIAAQASGYTTRASCEIEDFQHSVLELRLPSADHHRDVRVLRGSDLPRVDLMTGGFPCQDISSAGKGAGLAGERSGLWSEYLRLIEECRPRFVIIENVSVLRSRGLDVILNDLYVAGYMAWWDCVPALAVGAPHQRDRVWITAVRADEMPDVEAIGTPTKKPMKFTPGKLPRAGALNARGYVELMPQATVRDAKAAMGAAKREDGTTWLTRLDSPLFPTPRAQERQQSNSRDSYVALSKWVQDHPQPLQSMAGQAMWPTSGQRPQVGRGLPGPGRSEHRKGGAKVRTAVDEEEKAASDEQKQENEQEVWPTPRASANELRTTKGAPSHGSTHGRVLSGQVADRERENGREVPRGTQSAGPLNPDWVEWLMGAPVGWTDLSCEHPVQLDWLSEHGLPRVMRDVPDRKGRLQSLGNALVWQIMYLRIQQAHRLLGIA